MTTDIRLMGPHARASYASRMQALEEFGINSEEIDFLNHGKSLAKQGKRHRELILQGE